MRRRVWWAFGVLALVLLVVLAYLAWSAWTARAALVSARDDAASLRTALVEGDRRGADEALDRLREHADTAHARTSGPVWATLTVLPVVGDDVHGVREVSRVLDELVADGVAPLVDGGLLVPDRLLPEDGRVPVGEMERLARPVAAAARAIDAGARSLAELDPTSYVGPLATAVGDVQAEVGDVADAAGAAAIALDIAPGMLGADGPRTTLVLFQNNAELRTTGGIPGATAEVRSDDGRMEIVRQSASTPRTPGPVLPLDRAERELYDVDLGEYYQNATLVPHFPRAAQLAAAHWRREFGTAADAVVSVDPVAVSYLLGATGPVTVSAAGTEVELTEANVVRVLLHDAYQRFDPVVQDAFFAAVAKQVFERVLGGEGDLDGAAVLRALGRSADEGRLLVSSFRPGEQDELAGTLVAGEVVEAKRPSQLGVYLNDATASKMSFFLDHDVEVEATDCTDGSRRYSGTVTLTSSAPQGGEGLSPSVIGEGDDAVVRPGEQLVQVELQAPQGGTIESATIDGRKAPVFPVTYRGHETIQTFALVRPDATSRITFEMTGPDVRTRVRVTPGVRPEGESSVVGAGC